MSDTTQKNVVINVSAPGTEKVAAQFRSLAQEAEKAHKAMMAESRSGFRGASSGGAGAASAGSGGAGGIAGKAGVPMAVIGAVVKGMDAVAKSANILNNSFATSAQKVDSFVKEFVPFGETLVRFRDAVNGTTDALERQKAKYTQLQKEDEIRAQFRGKIASAQLEQVSASALVRAHANIPGPSYQKFDRSTLAGERAAQAEDATIGTRSGMAQADREAAAARETAVAAAKAAKEANDRVRQQQVRVGVAQDALNANTRMENRGFRDTAGRDDAARNLLREQNKLAQELQGREEAINKAKEAGVSLAQKESAARKAAIEDAKAQLSILQQQESRMRGTAQGVGAMSRGERMASLHALKAYQDAGGEAPPEIEAAAARIAPDLVRKNQEKRGADFLENDAKNFLGDDKFQAAFGGDFGKGNTLKDIMGKVDQAKADVQVSINVDTDDLANKLAAAISPVLKSLVDAQQAALKNEVNKIRTGAIIANNAK